MRRITIHDGQTLDSIPIQLRGASYFSTIPLTIPDRFIVVLRRNRFSPPELRLTDFRGRVINRITPFGSVEQKYDVRWVPSRQKLVVTSQREVDGPTDLLTMNVTASRIEPEIDTVFSGLIRDISGSAFDISADGERLVYSDGPMETSLSTIDIDRIPPGRLAATQVLSSTTLLWAQISPAGDRILVARDVPRGGGHARQFSLIPRNGGAESHIPGAVENFLDFQWSPDGARIMYLHGIGGKRMSLVETDTTGRETREIARLEESNGAQFHPLPDGSICIKLPERERLSISIIRRPGKRDVTWHFPEWLTNTGGFATLSHSPDAKSLVVEGQNRSFDSVVVATVDIESGRFAKIGVFAGSDPNSVTWLNDGSIMSVFREPQGAWALYRVAPGGRAEKLGVLPTSQANFSVSKDGRHIAMFSYTDKNDVYVIRNFGKMLR